MTIHKSTWEVILLFFCSLVLFTWGLSSEEIVGFESRFFLFAKEMWQTGINWFPTTYFQPYPDYPATSTILIYFAAKLFGGLNKLTAVLPTAIAASFTIVFTYLIGSLHSKRWGFYAVCFLFLTISFLKGARSITLDMYPTMITACCFYLVYSADFAKRSARLWLLFPLLFLSFAFRGPIGLVIPTGVICSYYLIDKNYRKLFFIGCVALLLLIICTGALLALAQHVGGHAFMNDVLHMEVMGRMDSSNLPVFFYFTDAIGKYALSYPVACLVLLGVAYYYFYANKKLPEIDFLAKLFGWMLIILVGMSIPGDKKIRYILPMVPATALIAAYPFVVTTNEKYFVIIASLLQKFFLLLPIILIVATESVFYYANFHDIQISIPYFAIISFLAIMQFINFWLFYRYKSHTTFIFAVAALTLAIIQIYVIEPIELYVDRAKAFVLAMESLRAQDHARLVFYKENPDGLPIKYIVNMPQEEKPVYINSAQELQAYPAPTFFVTKVNNFDELPPVLADKFTIVGNDTLGHIRVVVFKNGK